MSYLCICRSSFSLLVALLVVFPGRFLFLQLHWHWITCLLSSLSRVEMLGSLADWQKLKNKFQNLSVLLQPIKADIGLNGSWWQTAGDVFEKLLDTYQGNPDKEWWKKIIVDESYDEFVVCGFSPEVGFSGWFMTDFLNQTFADAPTGLTSAPLTIRQLEIRV